MSWTSTYRDTCDRDAVLKDSAVQKSQNDIDSIYVEIEP